MYFIKINVSCVIIAGLLRNSLFINILINNVSLTALPEINSTWSIVLYKGHKKPRSSARSYCCISTCPLLAKGLDLWIAKLKRQDWNNVKAQTQFMSKRSSHELAALLVTEVTRFSLLSCKRPIWCLYTDKKSAYDMVRIQDIIPAALAASGGPGLADQSLLYLANRLNNRLTYLEFNGTIMGPIQDKRGLE